MPDLADYPELTAAGARAQYRELLRRTPVTIGRQVDFLPIETLLCLAASFRVNHRRYGARTAEQAPEPVPSLATLFSRRASSILAKMANLDGSRAHGGKWDILAGATLRDDSDRFTELYRLLLSAARFEGIDQDRLPDFLDLEEGGELTLLGQEELGVAELDSVRHDAARAAAGTVFTEPQTEQILLGAVRVGQHLFAQSVLQNCGGKCVFCGLNPAAFGAKRMLMAGHIKPWRHCTPTERLDSRNGLAACPAHDVAFDTGLISIDGDLRIETSRRLADAVETDRIVGQYFGRPPLLDVLLLPQEARPPSQNTSNGIARTSTSPQVHWGRSSTRCGRRRRPHVDAGTQMRRTRVRRGPCDHGSGS
jgi:putative restriction endonuclease